MDPVETLRAVLTALKDSGATRAQVKLEDIELNVEFPYELPVPPAGTAPTPGGWKSPENLDDPFDLGRAP